MNNRRRVLERTKTRVEQVFLQLRAPVSVVTCELLFNVALQPEEVVWRRQEPYQR